MPKYFSDDAIIRWPCTNEQFNVTEYIRANCEYPGTWSGEIEHVEKTNDSIVSAVRVFPTDEDRVASFYVVSFIKLKDDVSDATGEMPPKVYDHGAVEESTRGRA